ncbi:MAG: hypothetical protein HC883_04230 [Bdellovibrionaceae bacterium]|nr:hypothetical protein [Pseudobdellovibrionaceae bacterium]
MFFTIFNSIAIGWNVVDAEFVKFIGKRTSYDLLLLGEDLQRHSLSVILTYWHLCLGWLALSFAVGWSAKRFIATDESTNESLKSFSFWAWRLAFAVFVVLGMRGGFQLKPLHPMHAYFSTRHEIGLLTLNTPFKSDQKPPARRGPARKVFC